VAVDCLANSLVIDHITPSKRVKVKNQETIRFQTKQFSDIYRKISSTEHNDISLLLEKLNSKDKNYTGIL